MPEKPADEKLLACLERLAVLERSLLTRAAFEEGLSATQAQILLHVVGNSAGVKALSQEYGLAPGTVSEAVKSLVRKGLLERRPDGRDGRRHRLIPTAAGRRIAERVKAYQRPIADALVAVDGSAELLVALMTLLAVLVRRGVITETGMCLTCRHLRQGAGGFHCALIDVPLPPPSLRLRCSDHEPAAA